VRATPELAACRVQLISPEVRVEVPDETANPRLAARCWSLNVSSLCTSRSAVNPTQRVPANVELPASSLNYDGIAQEFVRLTLPTRAFCGDPDRIGVTFNALKPSRRDASASGLVTEPCLRSAFSTAIVTAGRPWFACSRKRVIEYVVGKPGTKADRGSSTALRGPRAEPCEPLIADLRTKTHSSRHGAHRCRQR